MIPKLGPVLDLAAGRGRHTALLVERGYQVLAVDREVSELRDRFADVSAVEIRAVDLEDGAPWSLGGGYSGVVVTNYLHRQLFPALSKALGYGGVLIYETFMTGNERFGRPSNPDFLLRPGELLEALSELTPIAFEQGQVEDPRPAMVQRLAAINGAVLKPLPLAEAGSG
ncbi:MAG TPA: SAM-dependent methyltransferase [Stellaceae bacterium]|nr:SAM-dependent methyltransferase [Stellaceae bacterium]